MYCPPAWLFRIPGEKVYILGPSAWRLSHQYDWGNMLIRVPRDHLKSLAMQTEETAHLAIREGKQALLDHVITHHLIAIAGQTGELAPSALYGAWQSAARGIATMPP